MATLTLKNVPAGLHARLKASAERNRRSLNSEILVRLEQDIERPVPDSLLQAEMLRAVATRLPQVALDRGARDEPLPDVLRPLFWDWPFDDLRWPVHRDFVIARVLQSGGTVAIAWLRDAVPDDELARWITQRNGRGLDARHLRFWQVALDLPATDVDRWVTLAREGVWEGRTRR
ncbi:MAG: Arc family DNA-binding protein [Acidobacteriota bacterium]